ncbi:UDP-N-acetylmuramoylalanyl-D-glutamyl-2,6-diaminopimelate--D-alanyl-D-alanine ligase [Candidatus Endowatersipora endosymbiont of Watersipora subatra]|uniref:UDP-N-acetylmuramoylalanyl-D-glutamyl-2, 6-diaminopimelate--D-alanyl-D-alanine ligase n=1 Tax=Candidatus Endowatersipora endosymbiont of Watersipora subatra TaxID=3077946 RepID=UPI00312CC1D9
MSDLLWTLPELLKITGGRLIGSWFLGVNGVSIDTRTLKYGDLYFAVRGDSLDGHDFIAKAVARGAAASCVSEEKIDSLIGERGNFIVVQDVSQALEELGKISRARMVGKIIAVTGSVGKTTTKEALKAAFSPNGPTHSSVESYNNHWGVLLTLARMPRDTKYGIFEIGMNGPGEIGELVKRVQPHLAIITNVEAAHLGAFESIDDISFAKAEIFDGLISGGTVLLNRDDERFSMLSEIARSRGIENIVTFGESEKSDSRAIQIVLQEEYSYLTASILGEKIALKVGSPGRHFIQNILAVLATVKFLGADLSQATLALSHFTALKGRGKRYPIDYKDKSFILIDESYNANPASMQSALKLLGLLKPKNSGRRIAILGDMLELGPHSSQFHADLAVSVQENLIDKVFLVGSKMRVLRDSLQGKISCKHVEKIECVITLVRVEIHSDDVLMVKASLGMRFSLLVDALLYNHQEANNDE